MKQILFLLFTFSFLSTFSQSMQFPTSVEWFRIQTNFGEIVYPKPLESDAVRIGRLLEAEQTLMYKTMPTKLRKVSIIFNNQLAMSNAYVAIAPYKSVWYSTPPQDPFNGTLDWYETLAKHEFRHVYQFNRLNRNFSKFWYFLYGEYGQAAASGLVPNWFFEGDAVLSETLLSHSGRGRVAEFDMPLRAKYLSGIKYSYYKSSLGSYKDYIPNHYYYGYLYTTYLRRKLGAEGVDQILEHTTKRSFWPFAFNLGLKKYTGKSWAGNFSDMTEDVGKLWAERQSTLSFTDFKQLNKAKKKCYTSYTEPAYLADGSVLCKKSSMKRIQEWVILQPDGKEKTISPCSTTEAYDLKGNTIVFTEAVPGARWGELGFSDVYELNLNSGHTKRLTRGQRFYSPTYSPDGSKLAVVEFDVNNQCFVAILNKKTKQVISRFQVQNNHIVRTPTWANDSSLVLIHSKESGFAIAEYSTTGKLQKELLPYSKSIVSQLEVAGNILFYHSDETGIDNLFALRLDNGTKYQVTSSAYGAFHPSVDASGKKLVFQDYTANGFNLAEIQLDSSKWTKAKQIKPNPVFYFEPLLKETKQQDIQIDSSRTFKPEKYNAFLNGINIHTWYAYSLGADTYAGFLSTNKLNTMSLNPEWAYNQNDQTVQSSLNLRFSKYFVVANALVSYGPRRVLNSVTIQNNNISYDYSYKNELTTQLGLELPLNFSRGIHTNLLTLKFGVNALHRNKPIEILGKINQTTKIYTDDYLGFYSTQLNFTSLEAMAPRDIFPKSGINAQLVVFQPQFSYAYFTSILSTYYFPGFFENNSIRLNFDREFQSENNFNSLVLIRGYPINYFCSAKYRTGINYTFPIAYPDLALGQYFYLRRLALNLFGDYGQIDYPFQYLYYYSGNPSNKYIGTSTGIEDLASVGAELMFSFNLLNLPYPIHTGIRASYRMLDKQLFYDILPITISF